MKKLIFRGGLMLFTLSFGLMAQWEQCSSGLNPGSVFSFLVIDNNLYAGTSNGMYISNNYGSSWQQTSLTSYNVYSLAANGSFIFASTMDNGVFRSSDNGQTWFLTSLNPETYQSLEVKGNDVYASNSLNVFRSGDNGNTWQEIYASQYPVIATLESNGSALFMGEHGVFVSSDNGSNWVQTLNTNPLIVNSIATSGNNVYAGAYGLHHSTDNGASWEPVSLDNVYVRSIYIQNNNIFAGTNNNGVYVSNDNGATWIQKNEGLGVSLPIIRCLSVCGGYIFAGTWQENVYRRNLNELVGIKPASNEIPNKYSLSQNYPNPFNPSTKIKFDIGQSAGNNSEFVQISVYDNLGKDIAALVKDNLSPGKYEVEWNAANYPSGVYYYKLITQDYSYTRKMILIK